MHADRNPGLLIAASAAIGVVVAWAGAQLATIVTTGTLFATSPAVVVRSTLRLLTHLDDPARAWPPDLAARLPGPVTSNRRNEHSTSKGGAALPSRTSAELRQ